MESSKAGGQMRLTGRWIEVGQEMKLEVDQEER